MILVKSRTHAANNPLVLFSGVGHARGCNGLEADLRPALPPTDLPAD